MAGNDGLSGQWIGTAEGTNDGLVVLDLDELENGFAGYAYLFDEAPGVPHSAARVQISGRVDKADNLNCPVSALHPQFPVVLSSLDLARDFQNIVFPQMATISLERQGDTVHAQWHTNIGTEGKAILYRSQANEPSNIKTVEGVSDWKLFKEYALDLPPRKYIFRGQDRPHRLRTSFHRTRRKDLITYLLQDIPTAHHTLTAQTKHIFNLNNTFENAAFLNLLQHHGFPTPLLDWTYSPFVAAFFAFRFRRARLPQDGKVRILIFDRTGWESTFQPVHAMAYAKPHFSFIEPLSIENPRALPQQSVSSVTNLNDVERFIELSEESQKAHFLSAVDLPFASRRKVMEELRLMGITAGSLFPGLDGACEELRGRFFHPFDRVIDQDSAK